MRRKVIVRNFLKRRILQQLRILRRPRHFGGRIPVRKVLEDLLVGTVAAHNVGKDKGTAGLQDAGQFGEEFRLVGGVAEDFATENVRKFVGPIGGEAVIEIVKNDGVGCNSQFGSLVGIHLVLFGRYVDSDDCRTLEPLGTFVGQSAVAASQIEHDGIGSDGTGPIEDRQEALVRFLARFVDRIGLLCEGAVVNVEAAAACVC